MKRILIVDDEPTTRQLLGTFLTQAGYQVEHRTDGYSALDTLKSSHFDVVILDVSLPHYSGLKVLKDMREHPKLQFTPVIVLSASDDEDDITKAQQIGISKYLIKPPEKPVILEEIEKALSNAKGF